MAAKMKHIALVMSLNKRFDRKVIEGVTRFVRDSNAWSVFLEDDPKAKIPDFSRGQFDGVIADLDDIRIPKYLVGLDVPVVGIGKIPSDCPWDLRISTVSTDNGKIAVMAAEHLLERGLRHYAYCGVPSPTVDPWNRERQEAFVGHLEGRGYTCALQTGRRRASQSWEQLQEDLAAWLEKLPKPLGVLAANDARARHVLEACRRAGLRVPDDVAVIGVDNDELICNLASPPLTSIIQGTEEIGYQAAALLSRTMRGSRRKLTQLVVDPVGVMTRQSTDLVATDDPVASVALAYIRQNACRGLGVAEVARHLDVSRSTLDARFKLAVGRTVRAEIQQAQLRAARELLISTHLPLEQVAQQTGFRSAQYLNAVFRRILGQTPGEYRRRAQ